MNRIPLLVSLFLGMFGAMITGSGLAYYTVHFRPKFPMCIMIFLAGALVSITLFAVSYSALTVWHLK